MIAALLLLLAAPPAAPAQDGDLVVRVGERDGDRVCTVQARQVAADRILLELTAQLGRDLEGFETVDLVPRVTVDLVDRPVEETVRFVLGAAGLRARIWPRAIEVLPELGADAGVEALYSAAEETYVAALYRHVGAPGGAGALFALAEIAEHAGDVEKAVAQYEELLEMYPDSRLVPETELRSARHLVTLERWGEAKARYEELYALPDSDRYDPEAWREIARCLLHLGDPLRSLRMLRALDREFPTEDPMERSRRLFVRAGAHVGLGESAEALRALDEANRLGRHAFTEFQGMELRAHALEQAGRASEAAIAWLAFGSKHGGETEREAIRRAAELALSAEGEELSVLFLYEMAAQRGYGPDLAPLRDEARSRLGLDRDPVGVQNAAQLLRNGLDLFGRGMTAEAVRVLSRIRHEFLRLEATDRREFALAFAQCLDTEGATDEAILVLREVAESLRDRKLREPLYLLAGEILERNGRFEEAIDAYGGRL